MSSVPVVLRPKPLTNLAIVCLVLTTFFLLQAILLYLMTRMSMTWLSLGLAAIFAVAALVLIRRARSTTVLINANQLVIHAGGMETIYDRDAIAEVDLSRTGAEVTMNDGTEVDLPLEGELLLQAAAVLAGPRV